MRRSRSGRIAIAGAARSSPPPWRIPTAPDPATASLRRQDDTGETLDGCRRRHAARMGDKLRIDEWPKTLRRRLRRRPANTAVPGVSVALASGGCGFTRSGRPAC